MNEMTVDDETGAEIVAGADADEPPILFLHGIDRQYRQGDVTLDILKGAELAIWPGQSVALVAPSGAGKSTLLHVAGLLEQPDAGEVFVDRVATFEKAHDIKVAAGPPLTIQGDADQLEQLLINLIRNAVDAVTETGGGTVRVGWQRVPASSPATVELWVEDEGPGLSNTGNLFVPFFTTKPGGSGIGLVLCRQIAEAHGGSLQLENRADRRGVRATLRVPVQQVQAAPMLSAASR